MEEVVKKAKEFALEEAKKYGDFPIPIVELGKKSVELAEKLNANKEIAEIGTYLMDIKLAQSLKENKVKEHIEMSVEATKEFLKQFKLEKEIKDKIINCVAAHHATIPFICKEAEICCNTDCYKFIHPKGIIGYLTLLGSRGKNLNECLDQVEYKLEEKYKILSLDICKEELKEYYPLFKKLIKEAREEQI